MFFVYRGCYGFFNNLNKMLLASSVLLGGFCDCKCTESKHEIDITPITRVKDILLQGEQVYKEQSSRVSQTMKDIPQTIFSLSIPEQSSHALDFIYLQTMRLWFDCLDHSKDTDFANTIFLLAKLGSPAAIEAVQKSTHLDIYKLNLSEKVISSIRTQLHPEIYDDSKIEQFIREAYSLNISISSNLERAISLATKAFWGREDLILEYEQLLNEIKKETGSDDICILAKRLLTICQLRDNEIANQILLWHEALYRTDPKNLVSCLFWAAICKELKLAQGTQKFSRYLRIWKEENVK